MQRRHVSGTMVHRYWGTWPGSDTVTRVSMPRVPWCTWHVCLVYIVISTLCLPHSEAVLNTGNPDAKRLYDDLLSNYNKLVRPVQNTTDPLTVRIKLKLSQLIDVVSILLSFLVEMSVLSVNPSSLFLFPIISTLADDESFNTM